MERVLSPDRGDAEADCGHPFDIQATALHVLGDGHRFPGNDYPGIAPMIDSRDEPTTDREWAAKLLWEHEQRYHKRTTSNPVELHSKWISLRGNWRGVVILGVTLGAMITAVAITYLITR